MKKKKTSSILRKFLLFNLTIFSILGAIALNGIRKLKTEINETIVVYGFGLIGNIASRILKASGLNIIVTDIDDSKREEAEKLGFKSVVISKYCKIPKNNYHINIIKVAKVHDVVKHLFG